MPKVSIIVPVYNTERYLVRCLDSLINQTLEDIEIIVVNDGSTDDSANIINEYREKDNRIKVINQENQGLSGARNSGINMATGKYIGFVDSDDYVDKKMFYELYKNIEKENVDLISCNYYRVNSLTKSKLNKKTPSKLLKVSEEEEFYLRYTWGDLTKYIEYSVWTSLYKNDIIKEYNIRFEKEKNIIEDYLFNMDYLKHVDKIYYLDLPLYYYYTDNEGSITNTINDKFINRVKLSTKRLEEKTTDIRVISLFTYRLFQYMLRHISLSNENFKEKNKKIKELVKDEFFLEKINKSGISKLNFEKRTIYVFYKLKCISLIILFINLVHKYYKLKESKK